MSEIPFQPAFPFTWTTDSSEHVEIGLTKREYFAAQAMQGILAKKGVSGNNTMVDADDITAAAKIAIWCADELIKKLEATK